MPGVVTTAVHYTLQPGDTTISVDASGGPVTISAPPAASMANAIVNIKKVDTSANAVTFDPAGSETVDGTATCSTSTAMLNMPVQSNGTAWLRL